LDDNTYMVVIICMWCCHQPNIIVTFTVPWLSAVVPQ